MGERPDTIARAEPVGSLLRSDAIKNRLDAVYGGQACAWRPAFSSARAGELAALDAIADEVVPELVRRQVEAGMDVVTDGEIRRSTFLSSFFDAVDGLAAPTERLIMHDDNGEVIYDGYNDPLIAGVLRKVDNPLLREAGALASAPVPFKLTIPAPSYFLSNIISSADETAYATRQDFVDDVVSIERELVAEAIAAGANWIQFDFPLYPGLADEAYGNSLAAERGMSAEELLDHALAVDRQVATGIPDGVTVAMHLCRGNMEGGIWQGSLEPIAARMFNELPHERFVIEWEDVSRAGDYSPLRHVPPGKVVALGLVSTKTPELEDDDDLVRRIEQASEHLPIDQLALCPQCGFASMSHDHLVTAEDAQWRKLELVGRVADRVWNGR